MSNWLPPGSDAALDAGCTCPVLDNGHGRGWGITVEGEIVWWLVAGCPLHDKAQDVSADDGNAQPRI